MCGIAGFIAADKNPDQAKNMAALASMTQSIARRGPDAEGFWREHPVYLGHRRLSILDLSPAGAQPMLSHDGRYAMVFNGEIFNHGALARRLVARGVAFKGHSDTEVLLEAISAFGLEACLQQIEGMFAIALWDRQAKTLCLIRDHLGKKPLYAGFLDGHFVFASELKAVRSGFAHKPPVCPRALALFTRFGFVPAPYSIYKDIFKLKPGHVLTVSLQDLHTCAPASLPARMQHYWEMPRGPATPHSPARLEDLLLRAVETRMVADVPIGSFLSGGLDSSLVTALMQKLSAKPVQTFSIGFEEGAFDESRHAARIAQHLGTQHHEFTVTARETRDVIPLLPDIYDEPFADYSQIPTYHLCRLARTKTTVALSGDGGDEFFCGYTRYFMAAALHKKARLLPHAVRYAAGSALTALPQNTLGALGKVAGSLHPRMAALHLDGKRLHSIARFLQARDLGDLGLSVLSLNSPVSKLLQNGQTAQAEEFLPRAAWGSPLDFLMRLDAGLYLPDDILVKVDRASMYNALEVRSPLLDKNVVEYALSLAVEDKIFAGQMRGKRPLYDLLLRHVPDELVNRPKQGFSVPMTAWLRGPLREWAEDLLSEVSIIETGFYEVRPLRRLWQQFLSGRSAHSDGLWTVLMAQAWHRRWNKA